MLYQHVALIWFLQNYCSVIYIITEFYLSYILHIFPFFWYRTTSYKYNVVIFILCIKDVTHITVINVFLFWEVDRHSLRLCLWTKLLLSTMFYFIKCTYTCKSLQTQQTCFFFAPFENSSYVICVSTKSHHTSKLKQTWCFLSCLS